MPILDDLQAFRINPDDPAQVAGAISVLAAAPQARLALVREWENATSQVMPRPLIDQLQEGALGRK